MAGGQRVSVAYGSDSLDASPTYTDLETVAGVHVNGWNSKRGRQYFTDKMQAGTGNADFSDEKGALDPTYASGPFYPMDPNCPMLFELYNPVAATYSKIMQGLIQAIPQRMRVQEAAVNQGTIAAVDLFSLLAIKEVPPGLDFDATGGGTSTANTSGDTTYSAQGVQDRMLAILADAGVPSALYTIFSGNVNVQATVYSPGYKILAALQDAADAEFPGVANLYVDKTGILTFHGRLARFNPTDPTYGIQTWKAGDHQAVLADSTKVSIATIVPDRDVTKVINNALCTPQQIPIAAIAGTPPPVGPDANGVYRQGQLLYHPASIAQFGPRPYTAQDLLTAGGESDGLNSLDETALFSEFYVANFNAAQTRIKQATFMAIAPGAPNAAAHWQFLTEVELNDILEITTTHPGGGGFTAEDYFVEGITYSIAPGGNGIPVILLTLDLSPRAYYTVEPWS